MGDYTGLRFRVKLTDQAHMAIKMAEQVYRTEGNMVPFWEIVRSQGIKIPKDFLAYGRSGFIPFGAVCYMPEDWGETRYDIEPATHRWNVVCSAKDVGYHEKSMMELFCEEVLPLLIAEPCTAEVLYEYWDEPKKIEVLPRMSKDDMIEDMLNMLEHIQHELGSSPKPEYQGLACYVEDYVNNIRDMKEAYDKSKNKP